MRHFSKGLNNMMAISFINQYKCFATFGTTSNSGVLRYAQWLPRLQQVTVPAPVPSELSLRPKGAALMPALCSEQLHYSFTGRTLPARYKC